MDTYINLSQHKWSNIFTIKQEAKPWMGNNKKIIFDVFKIEKKSKNTTNQRIQKDYDNMFLL